MANFGDLFAKDGIVYKITAVPEGEVTTYSWEALHRKVETLENTVTSSQTQSFLVPIGDIVTGVALEDLGTLIGAGTGIASALDYAEVKVIFVTDGGTATDSQIITTGDAVVEPADPEKALYTFTGWFDTPAGDGAEFTLATDTFAVNTYVYAVYTLPTE